MRIGAGRFKHALLPDVGPDVRPVGGRVRQSLFTALLPVLDGARVLDLCAGVGGLGLEALSLGAASLVLVESDRRTADALRRWLADRDLGAVARVVVGDARRAAPPGPYDLVFLDPPFPVWDAADTIRPFLAAAVAAAGPDGLVVLKLPTRAALPDDPRWRVVERRPQGDVAWAWLRATPAPPAPAGPGGAPAPAP